MCADICATSTSSRAQRKRHARPATSQGCCHSSPRTRKKLATVCACTPCAASTSSSAPWQAASERDTS